MSMSDGVRQKKRDYQRGCGASPAKRDCSPTVWDYTVPRVLGSHDQRERGCEASRLAKRERGQATITEFLVLIFFLCMVVGFAALVALAQPAKVAVHAAARNCARMAVESLSAGRGLSQAAQTAVLSLQNQNLEAEHAEVHLSANTWGRGEAVTCRVVYHVPAGDLPMVGWLWTDPTLPVESSVTLDIEPFKSRWWE